MAWQVEFAERPRKALRKLDKQAAARIIVALEAISNLDDPRLRGKALTGTLSGLWRYRVGDYRIIVKIEEDRFVIIVIEVAHRREVYR